MRLAELMGLTGPQMANAKLDNVFLYRMISKAKKKAPQKKKDNCQDFRLIQSVPIIDGLFFLIGREIVPYIVTQI